MFLCDIWWRAVWRWISRDWAAKGTALLGVKAVIAESFERIHRSNLVGMGLFPLSSLVVIQERRSVLLAMNQYRFLVWTKSSHYKR